ncbi:hypothetical protein [Kribbella deserti]|uniref:Uncharacterized protein n=1 Tax=Kribbella deserti TaxID=1926257 RepID=A0ABV6QP77_9ACTN
MTEMTRIAPIAAAPAGVSWRHWLRHFFEMLVAMVVGMALLDPLWQAILGDRIEITTLTMAVDMAIGMGVWMVYRGHGRRDLIEMSAAMIVPYLVLLVPFRLGWISAGDLEMGGHTAMIVAMVAVMLFRRRHYSAHQHGSHQHGSHQHGVDQHGSARPLIAAIGRRWPTWIALAMTADNWVDPLVPGPWVMLGLPVAFTLIGAIRGRLRDPRMLAIQLVGLGVYVGLAVVAAGTDPRTAGWIVAAGFALHALWDAVHHRYDAVVPRAYAEWCGVLDLVVAATIVLSWSA